MLDKISKKKAKEPIQTQSTFSEKKERRRGKKMHGDACF